MLMVLYHATAIVVAIAVGFNGFNVLNTRFRHLLFSFLATVLLHGTQKNKIDPRRNKIISFLLSGQKFFWCIRLREKIQSDSILAEINTFFWLQYCIYYGAMGLQKTRSVLGGGPQPKKKIVSGQYTAIQNSFVVATAWSLNSVTIVITNKNFSD